MGSPFSTTCVTLQNCLTLGGHLTYCDITCDVSAKAFVCCDQNREWGGGRTKITIVDWPSEVAEKRPGWPPTWSPLSLPYRLADTKSVKPPPDYPIYSASRVFYAVVLGFYT
jgi:hypothetical protein